MEVKVVVAAVVALYHLSSLNSRQTPTCARPFTEWTTTLQRL